ncbi:MAG: alpha/beta hydrolase [Planctomycetes bacterium]|nr:alpha/beta hydrolase [Planctomycetota bacterium]
MPRYWMITNRKREAGNLSAKLGPLSFWTTDVEEVDDLANWSSMSVSAFQRVLIEAADQLPDPGDAARNEEQKHLTVFVHGYDNTWASAATTYRGICRGLYKGANSLGICVLFTWPSDGMFTNYLPDRLDAVKSGPDLAEVLGRLYDWALRKQVEGATDPKRACKLKTSVIAHSMGNYVVQKAMPLVWTRKNHPLSVSLIHQLLMVAADVDNDLFAAGEEIDFSDGDAIANLTYRVTALYSGRDSVLGLSAGLKHFGTRRLGRSGLARDTRGGRMAPDNVWDFDCSPLFKPEQSGIHSAYFSEPRTLALMQNLLRGVDRGVLVNAAVGPPR